MVVVDKNKQKDEMKLNKKKLVLPAALLSLAVLMAFLVAVPVKADDETSSHKNLAQQLSSKLGISEDKTSSALNEIKTERQKERESRMNAKLDQAVKDGVITTEQKNKLIEKRAELQAERQKERQEMQQWFTDNGIDQSKLQDYMGGPRGHGGMRYGMDI